MIAKCAYLEAADIYKSELRQAWRIAKVASGEATVSYLPNEEVHDVALILARSFLGENPKEKTNPITRWSNQLGRIEIVDAMCLRFWKSQNISVVVRQH